MDAQTTSNWIQAVVAIVAGGSAIIALIIAKKDRDLARDLASQNAEQARLLFDLEHLQRLSFIIERNGHVDTHVARDMGSEAAALLHLFGEDRLPVTWRGKRHHSIEEAKEYAARDDTAPYKKQTIEILLEMQRVGRRLDELAAKRDPTPGG